MTEDITRIIQSLESGDSLAAGELLPLVYTELRRLAADKMRSEKSGHTLQPTALVHEAFLRLVGNEDLQQWKGRGHFFAAAGEAMRRILIENARRRSALKRGGEQKRINLDDDVWVDNEDAQAILELDEALLKLAAVDPMLVRIVELKFFTGLTVEQIAESLDISDRTVKRHWAYARAWLQREMR